MSSISQAYPDRVEVRGRDLTGDLMGRVGFTAYFHLLLTGSEPTDEQLEFLDLMLVAIAEHGLMPSNVAARMTLAADPESLQGAVAAGILGAGPLLLGTSAECARLLSGALGAGTTPDEVARGSTQRASACRASAIPCTGRSTLARSGSSSWRTHAASAARTSPSPVSCATPSPTTWGKPLPMNVSMPIAAVLLDLGFPVAAVESVPILARTASLLAHLAEERERPLGFTLARGAEDAVGYEPDARA